MIDAIDGMQLPTMIGCSVEGDWIEGKGFQRRCIPGLAGDG